MSQTSRKMTAITFKTGTSIIFRNHAFSCWTALAGRGERSGGA